MDDFTAEVFEHPTVKVGGYEEAREEIHAACQAIFYLSEDSPCVQALQAYLNEKGISPDGGSENEDDSDMHGDTC